MKLKLRNDMDNDKLTLQILFY